MGVARVVTTLPPEPADKTLPVLDRWAELIRRVNSWGALPGKTVGGDCMEVRRRPRIDCNKGNRKTILGGRRVDRDPERIEFCFGLLQRASIRADEQAHGSRGLAAGADQPIDQSFDPLASRVMRLSVIDKPHNAPSVAGKLDAAIEHPVGQDRKSTRLN